MDGKDVWCKRCGKLVHASGRTHVERVEKHVYSRCEKRPSSYKITDIYQPKMNAAVLKQFQERFAWWVYTTGMAFYKTEHHTLLEALQVLNPGICVPSAYQLANGLLDQAYDKSVQKLTLRLSGLVVTLETDAWTDINGMAVVNYVAVSGSLSFFLESVYTGNQSHDTDFLVADATRVLTKYKRLTFGSVITDNTATNKAMWEVMQSQYPNLFFHGCVCHALHLLVKDLLERLSWLRSLRDGCKELVAFFKRNHKLWFLLRLKLKEKKLRALALPGDTRWGSALACLDSVLAAESILFTIVSGRNFMDVKGKQQRTKRKTIFTIVTSREFVPSLKKGSALLRVVAKHHVTLEKDSTPISEVYNTFLELPTEFGLCGLTARDLKTVEEIVQERFDFIYGDAHGLSYLLDPRFCGEGMDVPREHRLSCSCRRGSERIKQTRYYYSWLVITAT